MDPLVPRIPLWQGPPRYRSQPCVWSNVTPGHNLGVFFFQRDPFAA